MRIRTLRSADQLKRCARDIQLNMCLAANTYLGALSLVRTNEGGLRLGGEGEPVDAVVKMRRLRRNLMLDACIANQCVSQPPASFHLRISSLSSIEASSASPFPQRTMCSAQNSSSRPEYELTRGELDLAPLLVRRAIQRQRRLLDRVKHECATRASHHIIQVHGDLKPAHIYLGHPPTVIDRLDFSADLRTMDPYEEIASLQVECRPLVALWIAELVRRTYQEQANDHISANLYQFYQGQRALTRAKLVAWHLLDPDVAKLQAWRDIASDYLSLVAVAV